MFLLRNLNPVVVTLLEVEANHNGETLISRFVEALHYYCALFSSLEGSLGRDSPDRYRVESMSFASEIKSIVAKDESCGSRHMKSDADGIESQNSLNSVTAKPLPEAQETASPKKNTSPQLPKTETETNQPQNVAI